MKKSLFLIPAAALTLASCSNDDFSNENGNFTGEKELHYMAVNLVDNADVTRAYDNSTASNYEDGSDAENEVKSIRFYLFNADGSSFASKTYCDATAEPAGSNAPNVEKKLQAVIVFETEKTTTGTPSTPAKIIAVLNPPAGLTTTPANISALQNEVQNFKNNGTTNFTTSGSFIMTNAVYAEGATDGSAAAATEHVAYDVKSTDIKESKADALANPVDIYVERVVAKAKVTLSSRLQSKKVTIPGEGNDNVYELTLTGSDNKIYDSDGNAGATKTIYVKLLGWNVTGTAKTSRLVKKIDPSWGGTYWNEGNFSWGATNAWNYPAYHRSFWALNPTTFESVETNQVTTVLDFGNFNSSEINAANACTDFTGETPVYMQENASWKNGENPVYPTKLIVAAQLVDEQGKEVKLGWYAGSYYLQDDLKQVILNNAKIFKRSEVSGVITYTPVTTTDIPVDFMTATEADAFDQNGNRKSGVSGQVNRYNSYGKTTLTSVAPATYYVKDGSGNYSEIASVDAIDAKLKEVGAVKVWKDGYTYYWTDITHLGVPTDDNQHNYGETGIVRNHIYSYELNSFMGFGIPVEKPGETIYPEVPNDPEMMYIAARINILSWRLVDHLGADLGW